MVNTKSYKYSNKLVHNAYNPATKPGAVLGQDEGWWQDGPRGTTPITTDGARVERLATLW